MIRLLVDQYFNRHILHGLRQREPASDIVHVRDVGLDAADDPTILEWAAAHDRILLTHDRRTIPPFAYARVAAGQPMPGVFLVGAALAVGPAIDELRIALNCLTLEECKDIVRCFPM